MNLNGSWVRGDVYIFAHAFNGSTLALPYLPNEVGTNRLDLQDAEGKYINREMSCIAQHGGGFYHYLYRNPISNVSQEKVSYVMKVNDSWYLGAGIYKNESDLTGPNTTFSEVFPADGELMWRYMQVNDAVNANLTKIYKNLTAACLSLSKTGLTGEDADHILNNLTHTDPSVIDCITIDINGTILAVEPEEYRNITGINLASQEHIHQLLATKLPTGFRSIMSVEGFYAIDCALPVFNEAGDFIGASTVMFNASKFFSRIIGPYQPGGGAKFWVMDTKGVILYETDSSQIEMSMEDPIFEQFPVLLALSERTMAERSGYGTYEFFDESHQQIIKRGSYWTTTGNLGDEFRLILTVDLE